MSEVEEREQRGRELEAAFQEAMHKTEARPGFYKLLMSATVYAVGRQEKQAAGTPHLQLKQWKQPDGTLALPFFATYVAFRQMFGPEEEYVTLPAVDLFRLAGKDSTLVLNTPDGAKDFQRDEIAGLLTAALGDPLANALAAAAQNQDKAKAPALWNDFYNTLANSTVLALAKPAGEGAQAPLTEKREIKPGETISISTWKHPKLDGPVVPFFSSQAVMNKLVPEGESYIALPAPEFLQMASGFDCPLALNPGADIFKLFPPQEVKQILDVMHKVEEKTQEAARPLNPFEAGM